MKEKPSLRIVFVCLAGFCLLFAASFVLLAFRVSPESHNFAFDPTDVTCVDHEGNRYGISTVGRQAVLFLSSSLADEGELSLFLADDYTGPTVNVNGVPMAAGEKTVFAFSGTDTELSFTAGVSALKVKAVRSQGIPMLCIDTASGSMSAVHADKDRKEAGSLRLFDESGALLLEQELAYIKGRGNQTWHYAKRPYNFKLSQRASLLGMAEAKEWCLLDDYTDPTALRNKLCYSLANGMPFVWSPSCEYVDLWLNGEYAGLYLLTEKINVSKNRLDLYDIEEATEALNGGDLSVFPAIETENFRCYDIPNDPADITDGYVIELESIERCRENPSWFLLDDGTSFTVKEPTYISEAQMLYLRGYMQQLADCLASKTGRERATGRSLADFVDVESFALKYLFEEIVGNQDAEWSSQYFCFSGGRLFAGPCWDYDHTFGNGSLPLANPETLIATWRSRYLGTDIWYSRFLSYPGFAEEVSRVYRTAVRPLLDALPRQLDTLAAGTETALKMNALRWSVPTEDDTLVSARDALRDYLKKRIAFLDRLWIDEEETITVSFVSGGYERLASFTVPLGTSLLDLYDTGLGVTVDHAVVMDRDTGAVVLDLTKPLYEDAVFSVRGN